MDEQRSSEQDDVREGDPIYHEGAPAGTGTSGSFADPDGEYAESADGAARGDREGDPDARRDLGENGYEADQPDDVDAGLREQAEAAHDRGDGHADRERHER